MIDSRSQIIKVIKYIFNLSKSILILSYLNHIFIKLKYQKNYICELDITFYLIRKIVLINDSKLT